MNIDTAEYDRLAAQVAALEETIAALQQRGEELAERVEQATAAEAVMRRARYDPPAPRRRHLRSIR